MDYRSIFDRAMSQKLAEYTFSDNESILNNIEERAKKMNNNESVSQKIKGLFTGKRKFLTIPIMMATALVPTGAAIHEFNYYAEYYTSHFGELQVGRYYLETLEGYDPECYIEVFDNNTLQFFGTEQKAYFDNGNYYDWNSAPVEYRVWLNIPFIQLNDAWDSLHNSDGDSVGFPGSGVGLSYEDDNTLSICVPLSEHPDVKDHSSEENKRQFEENGIVTGFFVYEAISQSE